MHRYFIEMAYNGSRFHGWQIQPNAISVQEVMNDALNKALRQDINVVGCGRTDTGVHASYFVAHFDCVGVIEDPEQLVFKVNRIVGKDIVVYSILKVDGEAHSRFHASSRTYHYYLQTEKNPFLSEFSYRPLFRVDIELMNKAAKLLFDYTDFTSFSKLHTDTKTNNCKILYAAWEPRAQGAVFVIKADRFLRNMVRAVVGTLLEVGRGKLSLQQFKKVIESMDRGEAGTSVPPQALFLVDIEYPQEVFESKVKRQPPFS
ncbi:tRNA pseudouridine(38-40) synthase TruA [Carboxylicivirga mesophila]|uniref:tRNA pseudouridine synthase A n=1 Tax=Carboxylicivirga mesophila TaxID=1166478 RepID=A0ABS5KC37_9BACT|nr:tRNA pseudouridine(38-40) synthase TruA [Carboxylicivirga mesophila]MBS2212442.1 tRNA pseudouridine(38-40) synthase TruA [Carboxylicivirga mesophila]